MARAGAGPRPRRASCWRRHTPDPKGEPDGLYGSEGEPDGLYGYEGEPDGLYGYEGEPDGLYGSGTGRGRPSSSIATKVKVAAVTLSRACVRKRRAQASTPMRMEVRPTRSTLA